MEKNVKRKITLILVLTVIIGSVFSMGGGIVEAKDSSSKKPFEYSITPKAPEWKNYTPQELKEMLNIPIEEAKKMDTKTLLKVVLDYPYLSDIYAFNDSIKALDSLAEQFNGRYLSSKLSYLIIKTKFLRNRFAIDMEPLPTWT